MNTSIVLDDLTMQDAFTLYDLYNAMNDNMLKCSAYCLDGKQIQNILEIKHYHSLNSYTLSYVVCFTDYSMYTYTPSMQVYSY